MTPDAPATPSLSVLAFRLRNRETWPPGYEFDFQRIETCAIGLAAILWPKAFPKGPDFRRAMKVFNLNEAWALHLFAPTYLRTMTLDQTADRISNYARMMG